jgi:NADH-quinone oxidoreductase subunit N
VMVYGMTWLYGLFGTLQVEEIAKRMNEVEGGIPLMLGISGLIIGMGFKISIVPLHFWCPDVFEGSGTDVAAFLSVASKGAALTMLMRTVLLLASGSDYHSTTVLTSVSIALGVLGAVTATVGNLGAFTQENIKRLLAYSSISHAGYMLCLLAIVTAGSVGAGAAQSADVAQAMLMYLTVYLFMNLGAFTVAASVERATEGGLALSDYAALGRRSPILAACMTLCLFSLVGLPPLAGFTAKLNLMLALANAGGWLWALVGVIGVNTVFSLYYYARVIRQMYLTDSETPPIRASKLGMAISMACCAMLVLMLIGFGQAKSLSGQFGKIQDVSLAK